MEQIQDLFGAGLEPTKFTWVHTSMRALLMFTVGLVLIRVANKRFLSKSTAFDVIVSIMLGTVLARAINGSGPIIGTIASGVVLVALHRFVAVIAFHSKFFDRLTKGDKRLLIDNGEYQPEGMKKSHFQKDDLHEQLRLSGVGTADAVDKAYLERNGDLSVLKKKSPPRVLDVKVEAGVQSVRIAID